MLSFVEDAIRFLRRGEKNLSDDLSFFSFFKSDAAWRVGTSSAGEDAGRFTGIVGFCGDSLAGVMFFGGDAMAGRTTGA